MADLPGPKIRIGQLAKEPLELRPGDTFILTTEQIQGDENRVSVTFEPLPNALKSGDTLFLNDGFIQLEVLKVQGKEVECRVVVGGELLSRLARDSTSPESILVFGSSQIVITRA